MTGSRASRRSFRGLGGSAAVAALFAERGLFAQQIDRKLTPTVEEGPFYPTKLPLDTDNDLIIVNDHVTPAVGEIAHVSGQLVDASGSPLRNAVIEIWQCDHSGVYLEEKTGTGGRRGGGRGAPPAGRPGGSPPGGPPGGAARGSGDDNFQGFGRFVTGSKGEYAFRTIKPVPYPGRPAPHVHFKIKAQGRDAWTTQLFIKGYAGNAQDGIYQGLGRASQELVSVEFTPMKDAVMPEFSAHFDIVVGGTPELPD